MKQALLAILEIHRRSDSRVGVCCEECTTYWPCRTYSVAARGLGLEVPNGQTAGAHLRP